MSEGILQEIYFRLKEHFGEQYWWPGETPFEIMVGAILTQNTNWTNVEKAIRRLRDAGLLELERMVELPPALLAEYIRPAGYYNIKAGRLLNLCHCIVQHASGCVDDFLDQPIEKLRPLLLMVKGIGPETADSIILYAANQPIFVVDTYTHRILSRHQLIEEESDYYALQELFMDNLELDVGLFNEYHALLVQTGKHFCRKKKPDCAHCPLESI